MTIFNKQQKGFTLVELMVSIVIGLFLLAGVLTVFTNSRQSQRVVDEDVRMMDDARFALETIAYDLRHAGGYGHHNHEGKVNVHNIYDQGLNGVGGKESEFTTVTDQCGGDESNWVVDVNKPVFA
ncbi:MAG: prepilin-type N-terminal cleavage/methylation domain-containing protein, partial [Gammaproteobacteria bacterium]|nr:prepilin-type N-terminal cleavage/methylation domain-containing protein [Gammaproteobacteria bacterium]